MLKENHEDILKLKNKKNKLVLKYPLKIYVENLRCPCKLFNKKSKKPRFEIFEKIYS